MFSSIRDDAAAAAFRTLCDQNTEAEKRRLMEQDTVSFFLSTQVIEPCGGILKPASERQEFEFEFNSDGKPVLFHL